MHTAHSMFTKTENGNLTDIIDLLLIKQEANYEFIKIANLSDH